MDFTKDNFQALFKKLRELYSKIKKDDSDKLNIIKVLHKEHDEVRLHSRFLAFLLSPIGSHGQGNYFLKSFLQYCNVKDFDFDNVEVYPTEDDKIEYRNIDILVLNRSKKKAIIIENKIYAGESNHDGRGQIEGYVNTVIKELNIEIENISVLYLSLFGQEPTETSLGEYKTLENVNGKTISYKEDIIQWLDKMSDAKRYLTSSNKFLFEYILQYKNVIKELTNYINMDDMEKLIKIMTESDENLEGAKFLLNNYEEIKNITIKKFWSEVSDKLKDKGFKDIRKELSVENDCGIYFKNPKNNFEHSIWFEIGAPIYWGIENKTLNNDENYFSFEENQFIILSNFDHDNTFKIIKKENRSQVIDDMINEILDYSNEFEL